MSKPLVVTIPHNLGQEEALRRLQTGLKTVTTRFSGQLVVHEERWTGEHLDFHVAALKQDVRGMLDVAKDSVTVSVELPWVLAMLGEKAKALLAKQGTLMLEKK